ncbi:carboxypeptidase regulatory-like domain-containing protein [Rubrivirga litoralis]|uniref:carboxypeptidase regulatory-like domain-containing protein n=1 Tax=Rubrivirga litoralis TaxID=3075598 RepID=UPI003D7705A4
MPRPAPLLLLSACALSACGGSRPHAEAPAPAGVFDESEAAVGLPLGSESRRIASGEFHDLTYIEGTYEVNRTGTGEGTRLARVTGGVVNGRTGAPVAGVRLGVIELLRKQRVESTRPGATTDSLGRFSLTLPPGRHQISVSYIGTPPFQVPVEVKAGDSVDVQARLGVHEIVCGIRVHWTD